MFFFLFLFSYTTATERFESPNISITKTDSITCFQLLQKGILDHIIVSFYLEEYGDAVPSMSICTTNKFWKDYRYDDKNTIQHYGIKQKIFRETSKRLYDISWTVFTTKTDFDAVLQEKLSLLSMRQISATVNEIAGEYYKTFFNYWSNFPNKNELCHNVRNPRVILYDRRTNSYEYVCNTAETVDALLSSLNAREKKIIKLIYPGIIYPDYYADLYNNDVLPTCHIYTENYNGKKFLQYVINQLLIPISVEISGFLETRANLIKVACNFLEYDVKKGNNILSAFCLDNLNAVCELHHETTIFKEMVERGDFCILKQLLCSGVHLKTRSCLSLLQAIVEKNDDLVDLLFQYGNQSIRKKLLKISEKNFYTVKINNYKKQ